MRTMPCGEYQGRPLDQIPDAYLVFLTGKELPVPVRTAIEQELLRRLKTPRAADAPRDRRGPESSDAVCDLIEAGRRAEARRYHPDAGGTHEDMVRVNNAADWLREQIRRIA